jgi:glutathione S-transferase
VNGRALLGLAVVPLAAGAIVPVDAVIDGPDVCPFRAATGLPCPLCGATRAFVLAGHADGRWLEYGAVWVVAAVAAIAIAVAGRPRLPGAPTAAATALAAWAWALAHAGTIAGGPDQI